MLKVSYVADVDANGDAQNLQVDKADGSRFGDELQAVRAAFNFMAQKGIDKLLLTYGKGVVTLEKGFDPDMRADSLFHSAKLFDLNRVNWSAPEWKLGEPTQNGGARDIAHAALRVSLRFGKRVSYEFGGVSAPAVEQKTPITDADITAATESYIKAWEAQYPRRWNRNV